MTTAEPGAGARRTWVLGGGAARGAAQVGVLLALFEAGVAPPDRILGVSVGALNGAVLARYPSLAGAQMLHETWTSKLVRQVFKMRPAELVISRLRGQGKLSVLPASALQHLVHRQLNLLGVEHFEELAVPFQVGVTSLGDGAAHLLDRGELFAPLVASCAIPGAFPGMDVDGERYFDGGVADNDPFGRAVEQGAQDVLAITLCGIEGGISRPSHWIELLGQAVSVMLYQRVLADFARYRDRARIAVLAPMLAPGTAWSLEPAHVSALMGRTRDATLRWLDEHGGLPPESLLIPLSIEA
ncbi:MAG: patatin-like phospholipase family protein [Candidatus Dormibacteraceae bacterium]